MLALRLRGRSVAGIGGRFPWYYSAAVCLIIVAAALRFYGLTYDLVNIDEAVVSVNSQGSFTETIAKTRTNNSSPILYPVMLYALQKIDNSPFAIRFLPALSGVLTVAAILLLLPRAGVRREAALLAALLATFAPAAIIEAQGAREYGVDALLAVLLIAGLLWYRRNGRKVLLCAALFIAPLLQYGLVLFGAAVIGAGLILPPRLCPAETPSAPETAGNGRKRIKDWLRRRISMAGPAAFFLAGCLASYLITVRRQLELGGWGWVNYGYGGAYYAGDEYTVALLLEFAFTALRNLIDIHLPHIAALAILGALALLLALAAGRRLGWRVAETETERGAAAWRATAILLGLTLAAAIAAGALALYPADVHRLTSYMSPIIHIFGGCVLYAAVCGVPALLRWRRPAALRTLICALSILLVVVGAAAVKPSVMYKYSGYLGNSVTAANFRTFLAESTAADDVVYTPGSLAAINDFYDRQHRTGKPDNHIYGNELCWAESDIGNCFRELSNVIMTRGDNPGRVWLLYGGPILPEQLLRWSELDGIDHVVNRPLVNLYRLEYDGLMANIQREWLAEYEPLLAGQPAAHGPFDVYYNSGRLTYDRAPCRPEDAKPTFLLHIIPIDPNALPEQRQSDGYENRDFNFLEQGGALLENRCLVSVALPDYDIASIRTGQYANAGRLWAVELAP